MLDVAVSVLTEYGPAALAIALAGSALYYIDRHARSDKHLHEALRAGQAAISGQLTDMRTEFEARAEGAHTARTKIREDMSDVRERVAKIEGHMGIGGD